MKNDKFVSLLNDFGSKVKGLYIPLPSFNFFHKASSEDEIDPKFMGRSRKSKQLTEWLLNGDTGSYLVSGYRGMGKSSFVGKVLNDITDTNRNRRKIAPILFVTLSVFFFLTVFISSISFINPIDFSYLNITIVIFLSSGVLLVILKTLKTDQRKVKKVKKIILNQFCENEKKEHETLNEKDKKNYQRFNEKVDSFYQQNEQWINEVYNIKPDIKDKRRIVIKINLGHEVLNERDILSLIAKQVHEKFKSYLNDDYVDPIQLKNIKIAVVSILSGVALVIISKLNFVFLLNTKYLSRIYISFYALYMQNNWIKLFIESICFTSLIFLGCFIINRIVKAIPSLNNKSSKSILNDLQHLTDRIETSIHEDSGPNASFSSQSLIGIYLNKRKSKTYAIANVREIEMELIHIFDRIYNHTLINFQNKLKFVIVFDELDKIDPELNKEIFNENDTVPEYRNLTSGFSGGMTSRLRKQNVLRLLGNMKLFLSTAKAKFIFISGRELYDALLADLSDREFAVSSIFNGAIYVDSFFEPSDDDIDINSKTSEYISRQLIPKEYYIESAQNKFESNIHSRLVPSISLYKSFLNKIFQNQTQEIEDFKTNNSNIFYINKVIIFISQFASYLAHISNGSPKKIALYFEKYISDYYWANDKNPYNSIDEEYKNKYFKNTKYCLEFSQIAQQNIGFIHYLTSPVVKAIMNKPTDFNDKVLISTSFLIDHIFKHHKGGFSWDNIEHIPELLEVYRTPELRDLISTILSFYQQSHITFISSGLYYYKIRKSISEEISYFSKISEEVSAIFNFTLDESLAVKKYYYQQIEHYIRLYNKHIESSNSTSFIGRNPYAITLINLYDILGELHLLDDEYADAIIQFQNELQFIKTEWDNYKINLGNNHNQDNTNEQGQLSLLIHMINNVLKLGLAHESQSTFNMAYTIYCELITYLVEFRYIDENRLGLNYAIENHPEEWNLKRIIFYNNRFSNNYSSSINGNIFKKEVSPSLLENSSSNNYSNINYRDINYMLTGDDLVSDLSTPLTPLKSSIISKLTLFEDVRYMFQIILAKLLVLEKINLGGITKANLDIAESEFAYMFLAVNIKDKFIIAADFYRKLAALLYFKNGYIIFEFRNKIFLQLEVWGYYVKNDIRDFCLNNRKNFNENYIPAQVLYEFIAFEFDGEIFDIDSSSYQYEKEQNNSNCDYCYEKNRSCESSINRINNIKLQLWKNIEKSLDSASKNAKCIPWNQDKKEIVEYFIKSPYFRFIDSTINPSFVNCSKYCKQMYQQGIQLPCYACNYYCRTLKIFQKHILGDGTSTTSGVSRVFFFINGLENIPKLTTLRTNYIATMASTLRGMADVQLSCITITKSNDNQHIVRESFLELFFEMVVRITEDTNKENSVDYKEIFYSKLPAIHRVEKVLLYYWTASEYFRIASSKKDTTECLKKILLVLKNSVIIDKSNATSISPFLSKIKEKILEKIILYSYSHYNNVDILEIQFLKKITKTNDFENISLNYLSFFPDIESAIWNYYELEVECGVIKNLPSCYNSKMFSPYRIDNSAFSRIHTLRFKTIMNQNIFKSVLNYQEDDHRFYDPNSIELFYKKLGKFWNSNYEINNSEYKKCLNIEHIKSEDIEKKIELIEFLISDSLYCLDHILNILTGSKFTQFNNTFIGDLYYQLYQWSQLYELYYMIVPKKMEQHHLIIDRVKKIIDVRCVVFNVSDFEKDIIFSSTRNNYQLCCEIFQEKINQKLDIKEKIQKLLGNNKTLHFNPNFSAEMAIKFYTKAKEMHTEGKAYKEFISNVYLVDDDINNAITSFSFACDRHFINCGYISKRVDPLKKLYSNATLYKVENYL